MSEFDNKKESEVIAVVAIGNSLRSDDGVAQVLVESLPSAIKEKLAIVDLGIHTSFIYEFIAQHKIAVLIDASSPSGSPGKVSVVELDIDGKRAAGSYAESAFPKSTHGLSLADEIAIARTAGLPSLCSKIFLFTVEIHDSNFGPCLNKSLAKHLPEIRCHLLELLNRLSVVPITSPSKAEERSFTKCGTEE